MRVKEAKNRKMFECRLRCFDETQVCIQRILQNMGVEYCASELSITAKLSFKDILKLEGAGIIKDDIKVSIKCYE